MTNFWQNPQKQKFIKQKDFRRVWEANSISKLHFLPHEQIGFFVEIHLVDWWAPRNQKTKKNKRGKIQDYPVLRMKEIPYLFKEL